MRPDDYFAEMLKSDKHMAKVKDKLIVEKQRMQAFEQRKKAQGKILYTKLCCLFCDIPGPIIGRLLLPWGRYSSLAGIERVNGRLRMYTTH